MKNNRQSVHVSACPHDCPSGCSLGVTVIDGERIGRVAGAKAQTYTAGVVCAKVARYAERVYNPERLLHPLRRVGAKGDGRFERISWNAAITEIAEAFTRATQEHGAAAVWPYHSGGTMGLIQRYGMEGFRNVLGYSRQHSSICMTPAESGWRAGVGALRGIDPREMSDSDLIVVWGGNPISTQVNLMTHITAARRKRGAKLVVIDVYRTPTVEQADVPVIIRPGTDGALALALMHVLLRDGLADREYLARFTDFDSDVERHIATRTPAWAARITGLDEAMIEELAQLYGATKRSFLRLGFGFTRSRNGAAAMHAVSCLPAVTGAWRERGGGAFFITWDRSDWGFDPTVAHALDRVDSSIRVLDQSRIGAVLTGDRHALKGGPPVHAMLMQNANPAEVAPGSRLVRQGLARDDLFLAVHEQFMTPTARFADIVLPATMFVEHDDIYAAYGHTHMTFGPRLVAPPGEALSNHDVRSMIGRSLGADHPCLHMTAGELIDDGFARAGLGGVAAIAETGWLDRARSFEESHFLNGFEQVSGRFRFRPDWSAIGPVPGRLPNIADWMDDYEGPDDAHPLKLVTPPARHFLNSSFTETATSVKKEGGAGPAVRVHPATAQALDIRDGGLAHIGNRRGDVFVTARFDDGLLPGTLVVEGIWPAASFPGGKGINTLVDERPVPPNGGVGFHDTAVWLRPASAGLTEQPGQGPFRSIQGG
ncbi:MAG: molybdopterin-dependent oxidoreductase [Hyphomicrobiaceae bacterium]